MFPLLIKTTEIFILFVLCVKLEKYVHNHTRKSGERKYLYGFSSKHFEARHLYLQEYSM